MSGNTQARKAEADIIGEAEKDSTEGVVHGQGHRLHGAMEEAAGKVQESLGHAMHKPDQELKGAAKQVEGQFEKSVGHDEEDASKAVFHSAFEADKDHVKDR